MPKLAINGGDKVRKKLFPSHNNIDQDEIMAVEEVLHSGVLSRFLGCWDPCFYGGEQVKNLEAEWAEYFNVKNAIAVNSATSGLYCAVGATEAGPGDEIIVSPYTMTASTTAALIYNAIPIFADIEEEFFDLDPDSIEANITERTKAIIVVDLFGQPYDMERINKIAKENNLLVIEDAAQAPGAKYHEKFAGTLGDIGVFSLNYHKHIHCGEGGIITTNNDDIAEKLRLIRNHAEAVVEDKGCSSLINMVGFNFRMTEIEAAIARIQLQKLDRLLNIRLKNIDYLSRGFSEIPCIKIPKVRDNCKHAYYTGPLKFNEEIAGFSREKFVDAIGAELMPFEKREAEGVKLNYGYVKPLYLEPIYQKLIAYGDKGCPFKCPWYFGKLNYKEGLCPVCEKINYKELILHEFMVPSMEEKDLDDVINAFDKVWKYHDEII